MASENVDRDAFLETIANELGTLNDRAKYEYLVRADEGGSTVLRIQRGTGQLWQLRMERDKSVDDPYNSKAYAYYWEPLKVREEQPA